MEAAVGAIAVGTGLQAFGAYSQGVEAQELADARAAAMVEDAEETKTAANIEARRIRAEGREMLARRKVAFAKGGVSPSTLSPLKVMEEDWADVQRDAYYTTEHGARGSSRLRHQAKWTKKGGKSAYKAGMWGAGASLLSGGGMIGLAGYDRGWWGRKRRTNG